jgi:pyruvate formate lyase activating enzyme
MEKEALYYNPVSSTKIQCHLCPHKCIISSDQYGRCMARKNENQILKAKTYGKLAASSIDPIEKKPLYNFYPGTHILSVGSTGCNMSCNFCQNCEISHATVETFPYYEEITPHELSDKAIMNGSNIGVAYTYNEPSIWFEFMKDTGKLIKDAGLKNVMISNGYINKEPLVKLIDFIDAFNIDLKAFTEVFYKKITQSSLTPVLETLKTIKKYNKHLEISFLVIPDLNDDDDDFFRMLNWIKAELGRDTILHINRYFPRYHSKQIPTPESKLVHLHDIAQQELDYVYLGNIDLKDTSDTFCPKCKTKVIVRNGYFSEIKNLDKAGKCKSCQYKVLTYI